MDQAQTLPLNEGQQAAADGFFAFLMDPNQKELILSGAGGVGKTFTMGHLIDEVMPRYYDACQLAAIQPKYHEVVMTATTNKAAAVLAEATNRPTQTVHSYFDLTVSQDFKTGESVLKRKKIWRIKTNAIIFIDECSMIDRALHKEILDGTLNCKIIYVGDHNQLAPIKEELSPIYKHRLPFFNLTQQMRTFIPELQAVNQQLRDTVETGVFNPIQLHPGLIDQYDGNQMEKCFKQLFSTQNRDARVMAYTNSRVIEYNNYIRNLRGLTGPYQVGEVLVSNNATELGAGEMLSVEEEVEVMNISPTTQAVCIDQERGVYLDVWFMDLQSSYGFYSNVMLPADRDHWDNLIKWYGKQKEFVTYFHLKNMYADLRPRDACTVHKAQGGTYKTAIIDLDDISNCRDPKVAARLLYVAFSRAQEHVILYGDLAPKFGGLVR